MAQQDAHLSWVLNGVVRGLLKRAPLHWERETVVGADGVEGTRLASRLSEVFSPSTRSPGRLKSLLLRSR